MKRSLVALCVGLALSTLVTEPATAAYYGGTETAFTGRLFSAGRNLNYCGVGQAQIGDWNNQAEGVAFTRPALWYGLCATNTVTTGWRDWLSVQMLTLRNGVVCGQTEMRRNPQETYIFGIAGKVCTNPVGLQEWRTVGRHLVYDSSTGRNVYGSSISAWAVY